MSRDIVVATFGSLLLATLVSGCDSGIGKEQAAGQAPERPVLVAPVQYQSISQARSLAATIRPPTESDLGFRVNGKVAQRLVQNGDRVRNGQALLVLDTNDLELQLEQAEAEVRAGHHELDSGCRRRGAHDHAQQGRLEYAGHA